MEREEWEDIRDEEIAAAAVLELPWTPWREMFPYENIGAMRCGRLPRSRTCTKEAIYVSYSTGIPDGITGRVVLCEGCFRQKAKQRKRK